MNIRKYLRGLYRKFSPAESRFSKIRLPLPEHSLSAWYQKTIAERNQANFNIMRRDAVPFNRLRKKADRGKFGGYRIVFFHIPKTGGTTMEYIMAKNYRPNATLHINAPAMDNNPAALMRAPMLPRVYMGHYESNDLHYQCMGRKFAHLTMLREPHSRVLSYYDYIKTSKNHPMYEAVQEMSVADFVASPRMDENQNFQLFRILGLLRNRERDRDTRSEEQMVDDAIETLQSCFSVVGVTEQFDQFLLTARRVLGWKDIFYERKNVSRQKTRLSDLPDREQEIVRSHNALDTALYEFARDLAQKRADKLGISDSEMAQWQQDNASYVAMTTRSIRTEDG